MSGARKLERIAFVGNYLPRQCGIATFTHDLCEAVAGEAPTAQCYVGAVNDRAAGYDYPGRVRLQLQHDDIHSYRRAAEQLNYSDASVVSLQHEFGIYGGEAGSHVLALLRELRMPVVTTLHTVLRDPNPKQKQVMLEVIDRSGRLVVMARKGADVLRDTWHVPESKIDIIPHGIADVPYAASDLGKAAYGVAGRKVLLTFGLIGPGKGIEHAIAAMPAILKRHPTAIYVVLGATHPQLLLREGERYRRELELLAEACGVTDQMLFCNRFVSHEDLHGYIGTTDIYFTPYVAEAQVTSGTLASVFGSGKVVVSTPYWHAKELLADDCGVLVPFADSAAIASEVCDLLDDPLRMEAMGQRAYAMGRDMIWPAVAKRYLESFRQARIERQPTEQALVADWALGVRPRNLPRQRLDHIDRMSDGTGIFQHAIFTVPDFHQGYCTDDNARAYILCNWLAESEPDAFGGQLGRLATHYLAFLAATLDYATGRFRNFMSHTHEWLEAAGSEDSHGRALWAAGTGVNRSHDDGHRKLVEQLFMHGLSAVEQFSSPRAWSLALLGIDEFLHAQPGNGRATAMRALLVQRLVALWTKASSDEWPWFEPSVTYDNARICQALIVSGHATNQPQVVAIGLQSLSWLVSVQTTPKSHFRPIGSNGFYVRDGARADFDQQPIEAQAMVAACHAAYDATHDRAWLREAWRAFDWFLGRNDLNLPLYDAITGGCSDGLHQDRVSENQGAESTLAFHLALAEMRRMEHRLRMPLANTASMASTAVYAS